MPVPLLFKHWSAYTIGTVIRRIAGFLMIPVYTHYLSPADYGVIELIELFITLAILAFGVDCIAQSMVRIYYDFESPQKRDRVVSTAIVSVAVLGSLIVTVGIFLAPILSASVFSSNKYESLIVVSFIALFFGAIVDLLLTYERVRQNVMFFVCYALVDLFSLLSLNLYFIAYLKLGIWGFVLSKVIVMTAGALFLLGRTVPKVGLRVDLDIIKRMASFGAPLILAGLAFFVIHSSDRFFLNEYASLHAVGIYSLAYKFAVLLSVLVAEPFGRVWDVSLYSYANRDGWKSQFARVLAYLAFALVLVGLGISVLIDEALAVMANSRFHSAAAVVPLLILAYLVRECADFLRNMLYINKRSGLVSRLSLYCAVANIVLNYLLIKPYGIYGAALSTLLTWTFYFILCWRAEHKEFGANLPFVSIGWLIALAGAIYYATTVFRPDSWLLRVISDATWIALFVALVWASGYFTGEEKAELKTQGRGVLQRFGR